MPIFLQYEYLNSSVVKKCIWTLQHYIFQPVHFQVQTEKVWNISKVSLKRADIEAAMPLGNQN